MTRRLGGIEGKAWAALASLSLAVAGGFVMTGCGGDNTPATADAGDGGEGGMSDGPGDSAPDGGDAAKEAAPGQCATPSFVPGAGAVASGTSVTITSANLPAGGFIFYTTDGTLPNHISSPALTSGSSITIAAPVTIHAIAFGATCSDSNVATAAYTINSPPDAGPDAMPPCPTPTFAPNGMNPIPPGSNVAIAAAGLPMGGFIYYTTDGTNPSRTSLVYSGPVQVNQSETIRAFSAATTCTDSTIAGANFTTSVPDGGLPLPAFTPTATTAANDFLLALSETTPGALICYTLDGVTTPTCSTTATASMCTGTSQAYNAATRVSITGAVTSGAGTVTVQAIACGVGYTTTSPASQTYKLQVAVPTMVNPAPGALMYQNDSATHMTAVWPAPTLTTITTGASLQYTTDGTSMPTCGVASPGINVAASASMPLQITGNTTFNAIGCKTGYAPSSMPDTMTYTIQLNTPVMPSSGSPFYSAPTIAVDDTANRGSGDWICTTTDGTTAPLCGTAPMGCLAGTAGATVGITVNNTVVKAIACKPGLLSSAVATGGPYMLQLSPPGLTAPGFGTMTGLPITSYRIPVSGFTTPTVGQSQPITTPATPTVVAAGFFCVIKGGTPACGVNMCTTGTQLAAGAALPAMPVATDNWAVIGCPAATGPSAGYAPSAVTTVTYSSASGALAPNITPTTAGPYMTQLSPPTAGVPPVGPPVLIANTDPTTVTICYSTDGTAPACSNAACTAGTQVLGVAGAGSATLTFVVTSGGSLYSSATPPVASVTGGGGSCTGLVATVTAGAVTAVSGTCTGYTSAPTVTFTGGGGSGAAATAVASNTVVVPTVQANNTTVQAVACSTTLTQAAATPRTYNFQLAQPDFTLVQPMPVTGDLNGGGTVGAGQQITLSTTSNFTGEMIHYVTGGGTATCATGTSVASGTTITVPAASPFTLSAVACGTFPSATSQSPSAVRSASFTVPTATPTITNGVPTNPTGSLSWQNTFMATISSVTTGAQICYTTDGTAPTCSAGVCGGSATTIPAVNGVMVTISATGTKVRAVACTATLAQSATASADYTLTISNVVVNKPATCPSAVTLQLDQTATSTSVGGPTSGVILCYTTDGTPAPANPMCTLTPTIAGGSNAVCYNMGASGTAATPDPTAAPLLSTLSSTTPLSMTVCKAGFAPPATVPTTVPFTPYSNPIPTIDGLLQTGEWAADNTFPGSGGVTGYVSRDPTNLYLAVTGYTVAAGTDVVVYLGAHNMTGSTVPPPALGTTAIPFSANWAFSWATNATQTGITAYTFTAGAWSATTLAGATVGFNSGNTVEFSIPLADFGAITTLDVSGAIVTGVGTTPVQSAAWPSGGTLHYIANTLNSCRTPVQQLL